MAERKVTEKTKAIPHKIEQRLAELLRMGEFDQEEVEWCRRTYWQARDDWHTTLINCYEAALARLNAQSRKEPA